MIQKISNTSINILPTEVNLEGPQGEHALPIFYNHLFFFFFLSFFLFFAITLENYKLYWSCIDYYNVPRTFVYPNLIQICLTHNHLLFGRQLLYSCNRTSTVVTNLTVLSSITDKINRISNHFWDRWRNENVVNLRETQRTSKLKINFPKISVNDIMLVYVEKVPRQFGELP